MTRRSVWSRIGFRSIHYLAREFEVSVLFYVDDRFRSRRWRRHSDELLLARETAAVGKVIHYSISIHGTV